MPRAAALPCPFCSPQRGLPPGLVAGCKADGKPRLPPSLPHPPASEPAVMACGGPARALTSRHGDVLPSPLTEKRGRRGVRSRHMGPPQVPGSTRQARRAASRAARCAHSHRLAWTCGQGLALSESMCCQARTTALAPVIVVGHGFGVGCSASPPHVRAWHLSAFSVLTPFTNHVHLHRRNPRAGCMGTTPWGGAWVMVTCVTLH